jgi:hypothetical protein
MRDKQYDSMMENLADAMCSLKNVAVWFYAYK